MAYQGNQPLFGNNRKVDPITFNGSSSTFALTYAGTSISPGGPDSMIVSLNGVIQEPGIDYTISNANITFTTIPAIGDTFFGIVLGVRILVVDSVQRGGDSMTGPLNLNTIVQTTDLQAASKGYVDLVATGKLSSSFTKAQLNTALTDADVLTLNGAEDVTNKNIVENILVISTATTATAGKTYVLEGSAVLTLPATPSPGWVVSVVNRSGTTTCVVDRNGSNIMSLAENLTIDSLNFACDFVYADATKGWVIT